MNNAIELVDYGRESAELSYAHMIQMFHRFLIDHPDPSLVYADRSNHRPCRAADSPDVDAFGWARRRSSTVHAPSR